MQNKLKYHFDQIVNEIIVQITEAVATSVITALKDSTELNHGQPQNDVYLTSAEAATLFKISRSQLIKLRKKHSNFPVIKIESAVRFKQSELELFFRQKFNKEK